MNVGLIIALIIILLVLVMGYNIMLQYKLRVETTRKQENAHQVAIIDATEDLISSAHIIPFSKELMLCLHTRILDALMTMYELDAKNQQLAQRLENINQQIEKLKNSDLDNELPPLRVPGSDRQAIVMLKLVKRLRDTIRSEHNKGRFDTQAYISENARLETIQIRINIENVVKRANDAMVRGQSGTALQLLRKGLDALSTKSDQYSVKAREKLQSMHDELEQRRQTKNAAKLQQIEEKERENDMEMLFGEKKKW